MDLGTFMSCDDPEAVIKELSGEELTDMHREARLLVGEYARERKVMNQTATELYVEIIRRRGL